MANIIWDERQQLQERYRGFNILEVQKITIELLSSGSCVSMAKIGEGLYNKSFKLTIGNGKTVITRIPNLNVGSTFLATASEIAIMDFLRIILHLPVPKVLGWNSAADSTNRVEAEYIIIEHTLGKNLADTIENIVTIQHKLLSLEFSEYSCLLYRKDIPPRSHPAIVEGDNLSHKLKYNIGKIFSIGLIVDIIAWIQKYVNPYILGLFLWYPDLRTSNIFIDDDSSYIARIIDWQSTRAGPLSLEGCYPDFLDYSSDLILELPENYKQLDKNINLILSKVFRYLNGKTITDPIRFLFKCPIDFSSEEIRQYYKDSEGWNKDSWTSHAMYDQALSIYSQIQAQTAPHSSYDVLPKK
ncbi:kinase-like domain-containing protein [Aspergillus novoparasiticus]|uniref:Kinase-like domain-containing protein n=1 Tax=Aspergillus novoparasiticus TaxID=986946 RepID=A0A5N6ER48_9EURO|nr:kinase-like domain-containing protein [Aspergillus novoparasiticus]